MGTVFILTAASTIAVTAIYFLCVRKPGTPNNQAPSFPETREPQH